MGSLEGYLAWRLRSGVSESEIEFFRSVANREPPGHRVKEFDIVAGRRSGKDSVASAIACYAAVTFRNDGRVRPGERPLVMLIAADRTQARSLLGYVKGYFATIPAFKALIQRDTQDGLELTNGVDITVQTCDFKSSRGRTVLLALFNEVSFWASENSANPDVEVFRAIRPSLATLDGDAMMIMISSAYRRAGLLYDRWSRFYGVDDPNTLVIHAPTAALNPLISQATIQADLDDDPEAAKAEWLSQWRDDLASYITRTEIEACVDRGIVSRPPQSGVQYQAHVDASSGAGKDSFCASIGHRVDDTLIIDVAIEIKPPFAPSAAVAQIAATLRSYHISRVTCDRWGLNFVAAEFERHGITLDYSDKPSSEIFREALPIIRSGRCRLVDNDRMVNQFCNLERRILPSGGERIGHPERSNAHDDIAVVVAGCLVAMSTPLSGAEGWIEYYRRLAIEQGLDPARIESEYALDADTDPIRPPPSHGERGWRFHTQADWSQIRVPESLKAAGKITLRGRMHCFVHTAKGTVIDVHRTDVQDLLRRDSWRAANPEIAAQYGVMQ